tara:strand:+ start:877 stop:1062 length:186 start_codon:yes stop_codon:yes gene_type:complete
MKWEARKINEDKWGVFLVQKFCKTKEPVCYSASTGKYAQKSAIDSAERLTKSHQKDMRNTE